MDAIGKALQKISSQQISTGSKIIQGFNPRTGEIAVYRDRALDQKTAAKIMLDLAAGFEKMNSQMPRLIIDRMIANGFTCRRAMDAVAHVLDTYDRWDKSPSVADFINYDRRIKTKSYGELVKAASEGTASWDDYRPIDVGNEVPRWAKIDDIEKHQLKRWVPKQV